MLLRRRPAHSVQPVQEGAHERQRDAAGLPHQQVRPADLPRLLPAAEEASAGAPEQPDLEHHTRAPLHRHLRWHAP